MSAVFSGGPRLWNLSQVNASTIKTMKNYLRSLGSVALLAVVVSAAWAQDSFSLKRTPKVGDTMSYKLSVDLDVQGMAANYSATVKEKVVKVGSDGSFVIENSQASAKMTFSGQEQAIPDTGEVSKSTYAANGLVQLIEGSDADEGGYRLSTLQGFVIPDSPKKVGDRWEVKIPADKKTGVVAATAAYEVLAVETIGSRKTVKVKWNTKETEGSSPASADGTVWLDTTDFSLVRLEAKLTNAPVPGMGQSANMVVKLERIN